LSKAAENTTSPAGLVRTVWILVYIEA